MRTRNDNTKVSTELQVELAEYGILRNEAEEKAPLKKSGEPNFFGLDENYGGYDTSFGISIKSIQEKGQQVAFITPDIDTFDLLGTVNFTESISKMDTPSLRAAIRDLVDRI